MTHAASLVSGMGWSKKSSVFAVPLKLSATALSPQFRAFVCGQLAGLAAALVDLGLPDPVREARLRQVKIASCRGDAAKLLGQAHRLRLLLRRECSSLP